MDDRPAYFDKLSMQMERTRSAIALAEDVELRNILGYGEPHVASSFDRVKASLYKIWLWAKWFFSRPIVIHMGYCSEHCESDD